MRKLSWLAGLKSFAILIPIVIFSLGNSECSQAKPPGAPDFQWTPPIWVHDSSSMQIRRGSRSISCQSKQFDSFLSYPADAEAKAWAEYYRIVNLCEKWKKQ